MPEITRAGVKLHYADSGRGPAVVWHTGAGGDGRMWSLAGYPQALPGRRHLLLDHRGHGRSDRPQGVDAHLLAEYVADAIAVLDAAGVDRAALVGYSDGAVVLYELGAAVVGIGGVAHPDDSNADRSESAGLVRRLGTRRWIEEIAAGEAEAPSRWFVDNLADTDTEMVALELDGWSTAPTSCGVFPLIQAPTLIVCGEHENTDGAAELAAVALPAGRAVILPGFDHLQAFWRSDATAPHVRSFLDRHLPESAGGADPLDRACDYQDNGDPDGR